MRFTDVSIEGQTLQSTPAPSSQSTSKGLTGIGGWKGSKGTRGVPKNGRSGEQEMGIV